MSAKPKSAKLLIHHPKRISWCAIFEVCLLMRSIVITALALAMIGFAFQPAEGQITGREPACGCYCPYPDYESFNISPCTGRLSADACEDEMKELPPEKFQTICRRAQARLHTKPDGNPCKQLFAKICPAYCEDIGCYCGYSPDGGSAFARSGSRQPTVNVYEGPSASSRVTSYAINGSRVRYTQVMRVDGQEWFKASVLGGPSGWISSKDLACRRPGDKWPVNVEQLHLDLGTARGTAALVAGGRG